MLALRNSPTRNLLLTGHADRYHRRTDRRGYCFVRYIVGGIIVGSIIGALAARLVAMTSMPEMVALFNGSGGAASLLVGWATLYTGEVSTFAALAILLAILIGGMTFTGSLIAYGKLSETINSAALVFTGQQIVKA